MSCAIVAFACVQFRHQHVCSVGFLHRSIRECSISHFGYFVAWKDLSRLVCSIDNDASAGINWMVILQRAMSGNTCLV